MGQRHQVFLIARIRPHGTSLNQPGKYRCIAALHHQWCYGSLPLRAMRRLVSLVSQPDNAAVIRAELRGIPEEYCTPDVPHPFTTTLMYSAWTTDLESESFYASRGSILEVSGGCWETENDDGISVLDVTDPENPAYCFQGQSYDVCERFPEYRDAPLDAHRYLSLYYNLTEGQPLEYDDEDGDDMVPNEKERQRRNSLLNAVEELANVPIIPASTLREAWPYDEFTSPPRSPVPLPSVPSQATPNGPHGAVLALADMSLDIAVKHSILSANTTDIEKVLWLPGKAAGVKALLHALEPFPSSALHLLSIALKELKETTHIDLIGFHLRGAQVATILSTMDDPCSVDLSDNTVIVADEILDLIAASSSIRRIVLMGCSSVDGGRLLELVRSQPTRFRSVEGILHPAFCSLGKPVAYPSAFSCASWMVDHSVSRDCVSIPFFTAAQVVQAIADVIPWRDGLKSDRMRKSYYMSSALYAAFQSGTRRPGQSTRERTVMTVPRQSSRLSLVQKSLWTFIWKMPGHYGSDKAVVAKWWGFVHITRQEPQETDGDPVEMTIYDLQGFLQCMAQEGRPMPSDEAVVKLEKILYLKDEETGEYCCPLMKQEHLSEIK